MPQPTPIAVMTVDMALIRSAPCSPAPAKPQSMSICVHATTVMTRRTTRVTGTVHFSKVAIARNP